MVRRVRDQDFQTIFGDRLRKLLSNVLVLNLSVNVGRWIVEVGLDVLNRVTVAHRLAELLVKINAEIEEPVTPLSRFVRVLVSVGSLRVSVLDDGSPSVSNGFIFLAIEDRID
jgi:hypothetical protein